MENGEYKSSGLSPHRISLIILFILESVIIKIGSGGFSLITFAGWVLVCTVSIPVVLIIFFFIYGKEGIEQFGGILPQTFITAIYAATGVYALFCAYLSISGFCTFARIIMIPEAPAIWVMLPFLFLCIWLASKPTTVLLKIALTSLPFILLIIAVLFFASIPLFRYEAIPLTLRFEPDIFGAWKGADSPVFRTFTSLPAVLILLAEGEGKNRTSRRSAVKNSVAGTLIGAALFTLCMVQVLLLFSDRYIANLSHPYLSAVSVISADEVFLRADGLVYLMFFLCSLIRGAASFMCIARLCEKYRGSKGKTVPVILSLAGAAVLIYYLIS